MATSVALRKSLPSWPSVAMGAGVYFPCCLVLLPVVATGSAAALGVSAVTGSPGADMLTLAVVLGTFGIRLLVVPLIERKMGQRLRRWQFLVVWLVIAALAVTAVFMASPWGRGAIGAFWVQTFFVVMVGWMVFAKALPAVMAPRDLTRLRNFMEERRPDSARFITNRDLQVAGLTDEA